MYFSSSLFYSSKYSKDSPDGKPFIICMITPGNVYPGYLISFPFFFFFFFLFFSFLFLKNLKKLVTESPYIEGPITQENPEGFIRRPCKLGYQSHYTLGSFLSFHHFVSFSFPFILFKQKKSG